MEMGDHMTESKEKLISWLFETKAVRVCPEDKPFWYTSGTIGPYYINTHFLYGSEEKANDLLKLIDNVKHDHQGCPLKVRAAVRENYEKDDIYKGLIDEMSLFIKNNIEMDQVDYISGGERRDWFFSLMMADIFDKPHVTIYKDLSCTVSFGDRTEIMDNMDGKKVLHIADLITEASSYERAWIPAIEDRRGKMNWSVVVVDRMQGGGELLAGKGVESHAMISINISLFEKAFALGLINKEQYEMIREYMINPKEAMKKFINTHPEFLRNALSSDSKTRERAQLFISKNPYDLDEKVLSMYRDE